MSKPTNVMRENFDWFLNNYNTIFELCGECYVVIFKKQLVGVFDTITKAHSFLCENNLLGEANIQYCNGQVDGYTEYINKLGDVTNE